MLSELIKAVICETESLNVYLHRCWQTRAWFSHSGQGSPPASFWSASCPDISWHTYVRKTFILRNVHKCELFLGRSPGWTFILRNNSLELNAKELDEVHKQKSMFFERICPCRQSIRMVASSILKWIIRLDPRLTAFHLWLILDTMTRPA